MLSAITVSTKAQLNTALWRARGGDVISLQRGDYGVLNLKGRKFATPLTIKSVSADAPARFSGLRVQNVSNVVLQDLEITRARGKDSAWAKMAEITGATNFSLIGGFVHGPANGKWQDDMNGVRITDSNGVRISGVTFHDVRIALSIEDTRSFVIENNEFSYISSDAMVIPGTREGRIASNRVSTFRVAPGVHPDGIQCWTAGKRSGCKNIEITRNSFVASPGQEYQGIFFGDEAGVGGYDNVRIVGNVFTNLLWHAINVAGAGKALTINSNIVTAGPCCRSWIRTAGAASVSGNVAPTFWIAGKKGVPAGNREGGVYKP
ncbi:right-handed parallel beta-helix repeat-containing protein [Sphingomonas elodea]|uniref:right-handed parallel beta-helix repeat-containing protein n=1 Tax=Sphingomonas elodea TaxID=179878 RepID=UPI00058BB1F4|nr:right-handed parallel beta-helix repeat-containing protein [Sphingomonas elodea]